MAGEHCPHVPEGFCPDCLPGQGATIDDEYAAGVKRLQNLRKTERREIRERVHAAAELRAAGVVGPAVGREAHGAGALRATVGHFSHFYNPADSIAKAINNALDPAAPPPRKWVPKKRKFRPHTGPVLDADGRVRTDRFYRWPVAEVVQTSAGRYHLLWCLETFPDASDSDREIITAALAKQARLDLIKERAAASKKSV